MAHGRSWTFLNAFERSHDSTESCSISEGSTRTAGSVSGATLSAIRGSVSLRSIESSRLTMAKESLRQFARAVWGVDHLGDGGVASFRIVEPGARKLGLLQNHG